jgi:hypothetical protein
MAHFRRIADHSLDCFSIHWRHARPRNASDNQANLHFLLPSLIYSHCFYSALSVSLWLSFIFRPLLISFIQFDAIFFNTIA